MRSCEFLVTQEVRSCEFLVTQEDSVFDKNLFTPILKETTTICCLIDNNFYSVSFIIFYIDRDSNISHTNVCIQTCACIKIYANMYSIIKAVKIFTLHLFIFRSSGNTVIVIVNQLRL